MSDDMDNEETSPLVCECCGKEEPDFNEIEGTWVSIQVINGDLAVDVCDECAKSNEKLREALDIFAAHLHPPDNGA